MSAERKHPIKVVPLKGAERAFALMQEACSLRIQEIETLYNTPPESGLTSITIDAHAGHIQVYWYGTVPPSLRMLADSTANCGLRVTIFKARYSRSQLEAAAETAMARGLSRNDKLFNDLGNIGITINTTSHLSDGSGIFCTVSVASSQERVAALETARHVLEVDTLVHFELAERSAPVPL